MVGATLTMGCTGPVTGVMKLWTAVTAGREPCIPHGRSGEGVVDLDSCCTISVGGVDDTSAVCMESAMVDVHAASGVVLLTSAVLVEDSVTGRETVGGI